MENRRKQVKNHYLELSDKECVGQPFKTSLIYSWVFIQGDDHLFHVYVYEYTIASFFVFPRCSRADITIYSSLTGSFFCSTLNWDDMIKKKWMRTFVIV